MTYFYILHIRNIVLLYIIVSRYLYYYNCFFTEMFLNKIANR